MSPEQRRRAAEWLESAAAHLKHVRMPDGASAADEPDALARLLREQAEAMEQTKPRRPVEVCPACNGTGWQD